MFDEPSRQREGSPHAAAAGKFGQSWTAKNTLKEAVRLNDIMLVKV